MLGLSIVRESLVLSTRGLTTAAMRLLHLFACLSDTAVPYRLLARRYHPDRHPASNDVEKSRLARVFADLNDDHRSLLAALDALSAPAS